MTEPKVEWTEMQHITEAEKQALVLVLSLAENHPMWTEQRGNPQSFKDEVYEAIQTVREFLKRNGVVTLYALMQQLEDRQRKLEEKQQ